MFAFHRLATVATYCPVTVATCSLATVATCSLVTVATYSLATVATLKWLWLPAAVEGHETT